MKKNYLLLSWLIFSFATADLFGQAAPEAGLGKAVTLESSRSEGIEIANHASLQWGQSSFTIEAWIKRSSGSGFFTIAGKQNTAGGTGWFLRFNDNHLSFVTLGGITNYVDGTTDITDNNWHHIAAVADASAKTLTLYIDGIVEKSVNFSTASNISNIQKLGVGFKPNYGEYFNGSIDDVRIWTTARSAAEIKEYLNTPLSGTESGLVLYYNLEEGTGTAVTDISTNANNGTILNSDTDEWITGNIPYNASLDEDTFISLRLGGSDADDQASPTAYITQLPAHGKLYQTNNGVNKGAEITTTGISLTDASGNPRRVIYEPGADYNGPDNFQYMVNDGSNNSANTITVSLTIAAAPEPGLWTGATSTNFNLGSNWDDGNVPGSSTDITIPAGASNMPELTAASAVRNMTLENGTTLSLNGQSLAVSGNISVSGSGKMAGSAASSLTLTGTGASVLTFDQSTDGTTNALASLSINGSGALHTLTGKINIHALLSITAGNLNLDGHTIVLRSTSVSSTAMVAAVTGTITYGTGGKFTIERYLPAGKRAYRLLAPSVSGSANSTTISTIYQNWQNDGTFSAGIGTHITGNGSNGTDLTATMQHSMFTYTPGSLTYTEVTNTATDTLSAIRGYRIFIRGDRTASNITQNNNSGPGTPNINMNAATTLSASGRLICGDIVFNSTSTIVSGTDGWSWQSNNAPLTTNTGTDDSYSLIPNPYASMVDWNSVTLNDLSTTYYIWDPNKNLRGGYESYNSTGGVASSANVSRYIQPGQAFFVQTNAANPSLTISESHKNTTTANLLNAFKTNTVYPRLDIAIAYNSRPGVIADNCIAVYDNSFNAGIGAEDTYKLRNPDDNISITRNNIELGVEGRPVVNANDTVQLQLTGLQTDTSYTIRISTENFSLPPGYAAYLEDLYANTNIALVMGGTVTKSFIKSSDSSSFFNRFRIIFRPPGILPLDITHLNAFEKGNGNQLEWTNSSETNLREYVIEHSSNGISFNPAAVIEAKSNNGNTVRYKWYDALPFDGTTCYRIRVTAINGTLKYSPVVRVNRKRKGANIQVFPNPVQDEKVTLQLNGLEEGSYTIRIVNLTGNTVMQQKIEHNGGSTSQVLPLKGFSAGIYRLLVISNTLKLEKKLVLQ